MFRYILKRLLYAIPVFLGITFVIYTLINLAPGGPLSVLAASGEMSLSDLEALKISMGLDKPIVIRYFIWLGDLLHGDFGISYRTSQEVSLMISQRIMPSLMLTGTGILAAMLVGVPLGIISAYKPNSVWDHISTFISFIGASVPNFFLKPFTDLCFSCETEMVPHQWNAVLRYEREPAGPSASSGTAGRLSAGSSPSETILSRPDPAYWRF